MYELFFPISSATNQPGDIYSNLLPAVNRCYLTFWRQNYFLNFGTPLYKMWIIQERNMLDLWNKLHFEEEKTESIHHV